MSPHIMVFDSGIGGTTVLKHIQQYVPDGRYSYFMDNAYLPYGKLSQQTIIQRLTGLLIFIETQQLNVDVLVIACNTASTSALSALRELTTIPIVGVVPAIKPAALLSKSQHIALLATPATVQSSYTQQLISQHGQAVTVHLYASVELVTLAEQTYQSKKITQDKLVAELDSLAIDKRVDVVVLGCTHFPILAKGLNEYFNSTVLLLDSGVAIAKRVCAILKGHNIDCSDELDANCTGKKKPLRYYATASIYVDKQPVELVTLIDPTQNEKS